MLIMAIRPKTQSVAISVICNRVRRPWFNSICTVLLHFNSYKIFCVHINKTGWEYNRKERLRISYKFKLLTLYLLQQYSPKRCVSVSKRKFICRRNYCVHIHAGNDVLQWRPSGVSQQQLLGQYGCVIWHFFFQYVLVDRACSELVTQHQGLIVLPQSSVTV